jgi:hypothetical protein
MVFACNKSSGVMSTYPNKHIYIIACTGTYTLLRAQAHIHYSVRVVQTGWVNGGPDGQVDGCIGSMPVQGGGLIYDI